MIDATPSTARKLIESVPVWDHHACMPLRPNDPSFLPQLARHRAAGFDAITLNIGFGDQTPEQHMQMIASLRNWLLERPQEYLLLQQAEDIERAHATGRLAVGFDIEGANAVGGQLSLIQHYYNLGVR